MYYILFPTDYHTLRTITPTTFISYISLVSPFTRTNLPHPVDHIRVASRKKGKKRPNVFTDDRGYPDEQDDFEFLSSDIVGPIVRKRKHPARDPTDIDPSFAISFDAAIHGDELKSNLKCDHLSQATQLRLITLIKKYWCVFCKEKVKIPVRDYECVINTGSSRPISVKNLAYGERESVVM